MYSILFYCQISGIDLFEYWTLNLNIISLKDWGGNPPNTFLGSYQLEYDRSWTPLSEVKERERDIVAIQRAIMAAAPAITHPIPCKTDNPSTDLALFK